MKKWIVKSPNGRYQFSGTPKEIVLQMTRHDFLVSSKWHYMKEVRERLRVVYEINIQVVEKDFEGFLEQLEKHGLITIKMVN